MSDMQEAIKELSTALSEIALPKRFLEGYDQLECLAYSHATETYLVRQKGSNMLCIAKCYDRKSYKAVNESGILKTLRHEGLPAFVDEYEDDATVCIVREYIEGTPLDKYMAQHSLSQSVPSCGAAFHHSGKQRVGVCAIIPRFQLLNCTDAEFVIQAEDLLAVA